MKKILLCVLLTHFSALAFGQIDFAKYTFSNFCDAAKQPIAIVPALQDNALFSVGFAIKDAYPNLRDTAFEAKRNRDCILGKVDSSDVHLFVHGINRTNAKDYEFRITDNKGKVAVEWTTIHQFAAAHTQEFDKIPEGAGYLGGYKTSWNQYLVVDIRKKGTDKIVASIVMYGQQIKPVLLNIYTNNELNNFLGKVSQSFPLELNEDEKQKWTAKYAPNDIDSNTFMPKKLFLEPNQKDVIFLFNTSMFPKGALEYQVIKEDEVDTDWRENDNFNNFIWLKNLEYGEYKLQVRLAIQRHNVLEYPFKIKPKWYQTNRFQMILGAMSVFVPVIFIGLFFLFQQKRKLKKQKRLNEKIGYELKSIRSQLNPHFVFNALNSIQGLMNKNELTQANYYLTEFSTLLRESLLRNDKENVPLSIELKTLETYIKLEQLRFPFSYIIDVDKQLDTNAIEIPYLLLQPLVENAIKHGMSNMYEKGILTVRIYPKNNYLIVEIHDNGKGFDMASETNGYGLKLSKERVRLLSESNAQQPVKLLMESNETTGTTAYLTFKNWL